jgi:hypothetical protein
MTWRRVACVFVVAIGWGLAISWLASTLPKPWGKVLLFVVLAVILCWAIRQLRWARRTLRELRGEDPKH